MFTPVKEGFCMIPHLEHLKCGAGNYRVKIMTSAKTLYVVPHMRLTVTTLTWRRSPLRLVRPMLAPEHRTAMK
jgi:hypothetical protein